MMSAESLHFPAVAAVSNRPRADRRSWSLRRWTGTEYDFRMMCLIAFSLCILGIGWAGVLMPNWTPAEMLGGGMQSPDDAPMVEQAPADSASSEDTPPEPPPPPADAMETPPEPVPVLVKDAVFVIPAPPEIVRPLTVAEVNPDRPKPQPSTQPRRAATPGPPGPPAAPAGAGAGPGPVAKPGKPRTPQPPYPSFARSGKMTGTVVVSLVVDASGGVVSVSVLRSCGYSQLDSHTCDYIRRAWHWPAGGRRTFTQNVVYRLR
jgi:protein TonB